MSKPDPLDAELQQVYEVFSDAHESQRDQLMQRIANEPRIVVPRSATTIRWSSLTRMVAALAAVLLLVLGSSVFLSLNTTKAYGIETLAQRLLSIRSLHVRGFLVEEVTNAEGVKVTKQFPIQWFFERPKRLWIQGYGFSNPGNGQPTIVREQTIGIEGDIQTIVDVDAAKRVVVPIDPRTTELRVELMIQSMMFEQIINGLPDRFVKVRSEIIDNVVCDLYELKSGHRVSDHGSLQRLWLNPRNGLPIRMEMFEMRDGGEPLPTMTLSEIRINEDAPKDLFPLARAGDLPLPQFNGIATESAAWAGPTMLGTWYALRLSPTKAMVCWTQHTVVNGEKQWFAHEPTFTSAESGKALQVKTLRDFESNGVRWRWSLVSVFADEELFRSSIDMRIKYDGHSASGGALPLQFPESRLQEVFDTMQQLTRGAQGDKRLTLKSLIE